MTCTRSPVTAVLEYDEAKIRLRLEWSRPDVEENMFGLLILGFSGYATGLASCTYPKFENTLYQGDLSKPAPHTVLIPSVLIMDTSFGPTLMIG